MKKAREERHGFLLIKPAGLPHLRPRRRVRAPGPVPNLRLRSIAVHRVQARGGGQSSALSSRRCDAVHPLHRSSIRTVAGVRTSASPAAAAWPRSARTSPNSSPPSCRNVIDLCPVGALTSKPSRSPPGDGSSHRRSIDVTGGLGSNIRSTRGTEVMRVVRAARRGQRGVDQRQGAVLLRRVKAAASGPAAGPRRKTGKLKPAAERARSRRRQDASDGPGADQGDRPGKLSDAESIVALKDLMNGIGAGNTVAEGMEASPPTLDLRTSSTPTSSASRMPTSCSAHRKRPEGGGARAQRASSQGQRRGRHARGVHRSPRRPHLSRGEAGRVGVRGGGARRRQAPLRAEAQGGQEPPRHRRRRFAPPRRPRRVAEADSQDVRRRRRRRPRRGVERVQRPARRGRDGGGAGPRLRPLHLRRVRTRRCR